MAHRTELIVEERTAEDIRQGISARRRSISHTIDRLETRIHQKLNWRETVARNPYPALGIAAGLGFCYHASSDLVDRRESACGTLSPKC
jgi:hypothetical protein